MSPDSFFLTMQGSYIIINRDLLSNHLALILSYAIESSQEKESHFIVNQPKFAIVDSNFTMDFVT